MKKVNLLLFFISMAISPTIHAITKVTVYCDEHYPPYSYKEEGKVKGIYYEILSKAFSQMQDYQVTIKPTAWKRGLAKIKSGEYFALYPPYYHPYTRPYMDYSAPILEEKLVVFTTQYISQRRQLHNWHWDFLGLTIGKNRGFTISKDPAYIETVKKGQIIEEEALDNQANILKLGLHRIDAYANDRLSILWELNRLKKSGQYDEGGKHDIIIEGPVLSFENGYLGITNRDNGRFTFKNDFLNKFNVIINKMKHSGEIEDIVVNYYSN